MKKIIYLLLLFSAFANAQLTINMPTELQSCTETSYGVFDLTSKNSEILGSLNPVQYSVSYYENYQDCLNAVNSIQNPTSYIKGSPGYVHARVFENLNPSNVGYTDLYLVPVFNNLISIKDLTIFETPNDNSAVFNLTNATQQNSQSSLSFSYFLTEADANANVNPILNPTSYTNVSNPQIIYMRAQVVSYNCFAISKFKLYVESDGIINFTNLNLKNKLLSADVSNSVASNVNPNSTVTWNVYSKIDTNLDGEIQFSEANEIIYLNISGSSASNSGIQNLQGLEHFKNLYHLNCKYGQLSSINFSVFEKLENFYCSYNSLTSLNLSNSPRLKIVDCSYNLLTSLNTDNCPKLYSMQARNNQLTSVNFNTNASLEFVYLVYNQLTNFQISNKNFLRTLEIGFNQLTNIQLTNLPLLYRVKAQNNNLTNVDLSSIAFQREPNNLSNDNELDIALNNNLNLNVVNLKNGFYNSNISFFSANMNNMPQFICVEDGDVFSDFTTTPNSVSNSYCSFNPGGNYNTITGSIIYDENVNGCDVADLPQPNIKIDITNNVGQQGSTFTNNSGNYKFYTDAGGFTLTPNMENTTWFTISPTTAAIPFGDNNNNTTTQNFCISPNGFHPDLEIVVAPIVPARPGFDAIYKIVYKNKGNQTLSQAYGVSFFYNENLMDFVSASVAPESINSGGLSWSYTNLLPFESRSVLVTLNINTPTDTNPVNIGDILQFTTSILPMAGDESTSDNLFQYNQTVVGAYDPNNIECMEGNVVPTSQIGNYLHYIINFENTGNYEAENIVVKTEIDPAQFDVSSLRMLNTSHNAYVRINNNIVEFIFENIALASGGHGNILLKVKSKSNLTAGAMVKKRADIFFDYNAPIDTGFENTVFQTLSNSSFDKDQSILIYPNPTNTIVNIKCDNTIKSIELYDVQGRVLITKMVSDYNAILDISNKSNGIYFLKITSENGIKVEKLIKE